MSSFKQNLHNVFYVDSVSSAAAPLDFKQRGQEPPESLFTIEATLKPFVAYQPEFINILGGNPRLTVVATETSYPFAHEAGVWIPKTREVFFTSNNFIPNSGEKQRQVRIEKLSVGSADSKDGYRWESVLPSDAILMANGATNYKDGILFCSQGHDDTPGALILMEPEPPYNTATILSNYYGRPFNAPNDVVIFPLDGTIWFTDPHYAEAQNFRPKKKLPNQVYAFDPKTGSVRVVADGINMPNGIAFSHDNKTCYITDSQVYDCQGNHHNDYMATIYAFDIILSPYSNKPDRPYVLVNRRVFAFADCGAPDGIKCDTKGNVYSGCKDGIHIWNSDGILVGKILISGGVANFCFTDPGTLILLNETKIYEAKIDSNVVGALNTSL